MLSKHLDFICCGKMAGIEVLELESNRLMWVYACLVCKKKYSKDVYNTTGEKIEATKVHLRRTKTIYEATGRV